MPCRAMLAKKAAGCSITRRAVAVKLLTGSERLKSHPVVALDAILTLLRRRGMLALQALDYNGRPELFGLRPSFLSVAGST